MNIAYIVMEYTLNLILPQATRYSPVIDILYSPDSGNVTYVLVVHFLDAGTQSPAPWYGTGMGGVDPLAMYRHAEFGWMARSI
jgi:hypothetical protein